MTRISGKRTSANGAEDARDYRTEPGYFGDAVWEHKRGKVWRIVEKLERENRWLRYQVKVLRCRAIRDLAPRNGADQKGSR